MTRALPALALASAVLLLPACADEGGSGDANPPNQQTEMPGPAPTE
jgi:hypothetical protein